MGRRPNFEKERIRTEGDGAPLVNHQPLSRGVQRRKKDKEGQSKIGRDRERERERELNSGRHTRKKVKERGTQRQFTEEKGKVRKNEKNKND